MLEKNMQLKECGCQKQGTYKQLPDQDQTLYMFHIKEQLKRALFELVKKSGNNWCVYSKAGKKLGTHTTKRAALKQLAAIEISKGK